MDPVGGVLSRDGIIGLEAYWKQQRFAYDTSDNLVYKGCHFLRDATTSDPNWEVWKYTWTGDLITLIEGPLQGAWDSRASLDWL